MTSPRTSQSPSRPPRSTVSAFALALCLGVWCYFSEPVSAQKYGEWTNWRRTNDSLVEWRSRIQNWGQNIASACEVEFRLTVDGTLTFRYSVSYQRWAAGSPTAGRRSGSLYNVKKDGQHGGASIDGCRQISEIAVSNVISVSGASRPPTTNSGRRTFSRPTLTNVRLELHCIDLLKAESEKLQLAGAAKKLLAWSPLSAVLGESSAAHAAFMIHETNWVELAESFSAVNRIVFIGLANDARLHANSSDHWNNPSAKTFWNAMADFYAAQADK